MDEKEKRAVPASFASPAVADPKKKEASVEPPCQKP